MMRIFAFLKSLIAFDRAFEQVVNVVPFYIKETYIPKLQAMAKRERNEAEKEKILGLIEEYKKYADPRTTEGRGISELTSRILGATVSAYRTNDSVNSEDVIQQIAGDFFVGQSDTDSDRMRKTMENFDPTQGPIKLRNFWADMLNKHTAHRFREEDRKTRQRPHVSPVDEEGRTVDIEEKHTDTEDEILAEMKEFFYQNVSRFTISNYKEEIAKEVFEIWLDESGEPGLGSVSMGSVYPKWKQMRESKDAASGRSIFFQGSKVAIVTVKAFLKQRAEGRYNKAAGKTAAERIAKDEFQIRLAKWILGE